MGRNLSRVGGAAAGAIAILFGVLDLLEKVPPPWIPISLGAVAVAGVIADYFVESRQEASSSKPSTTTRIKQKQKSGNSSQNFQAGRDIKDVQPTELPKADDDK
ncbi:hypothetical protein [Mycolicibacterium stellerae]|uniref:hypothetical protein n=1 Tax=Mycolicibacterium stellerae TaxID=2358193 RepID=UPI0013DD9AC0|nr:hypothetical protein [Mycolicibacterium stellerae]